MRSRTAAASIVALGWVASAVRGSLPVVTTFDASLESWQVVTFSGASGTGPTSYASPTATVMPTFVATGGQAGGYASMADPNSDWSYFAAPAAFLGNHADLYGAGVISFSERWFNTGIDPEPTIHHVVLVSGTTVIRSIPSGTPNNTWKTFQYPLSAGVWRVGSAVNGALATAGEIQGVLSNLTRVLVYAEYGAQVQEQMGLDTVRMALFGDANMNGRIDADDFALADRGAAKPLAGWANGDFNEDGVVNGTDYGLLGASLAAQGGFAGGMESPAAVAIVPEPVGTGSLVLICGVRARRARRM